MKRTMTTIAAIAALCLSACILPSCYVRISDDAKAKIQEELQDIDFTETLEPFDTLDNLKFLKFIGKFTSSFCKVIEFITTKFSSLHNLLNIRKF